MLAAADRDVVPTVPGTSNTEALQMASNGKEPTVPRATKNEWMFGGCCGALEATSYLCENALRFLAQNAAEHGSRRFGSCVTQERVDVVQRCWTCSSGFSGAVAVPWRPRRTSARTRCVFWRRTQPSMVLVDLGVVLPKNVLARRCFPPTSRRTCRACFGNYFRPHRSISCRCGFRSTSVVSSQGWSRLETYVAHFSGEAALRTGPCLGSMRCVRCP